ncbi:MAG: hypothetical protein KKA73_18505 [Chloroflexi bacterium]|nr:hypothetical protein [Chloroflexota bacterium]MBU1749680.1 hypothetical protein [Chloroflexota bacterium]
MFAKKACFTILVMGAVLTLVAGGGPAQARPPAQKPDPPVETASTPDHPGGGPLGTWWSLISPLHVHQEPDEAHPAVAYNSQQQEYLVVWERGYYGSSLKDICGQRVSRNGALVGPCITIAPTGYDLRDPAVAYNSQTNEYLVVYAWDVAGGIYGMRVSGATGQPVGSEITIATEASYSFSNPAVACAAESGGYLVVFERWGTGSYYGIRSVRVYNNGTVAGTSLDIDPVSNVTQPRYPSVAYNSARSEMLVVWQRLVSGTYDLYGQRVHMLAGGGYHAEGSVIPILNFVKDLKNPAVAALPQPAGVGQYLVVGQYEFSPTDRDIYAQRVAGDGTLTGSYLTIVSSTEDQTMPAVANSTTAQEYLVVCKEGDSLASVRARSVSMGGILGPNTLLYAWYADHPAVAGGPAGDYLVTERDMFELYEILGWLWGNRVYLPLTLKRY